MLHHQGFCSSLMLMRRQTGWGIARSTVELPVCRGRLWAAWSCLHSHDASYISVHRGGLGFLLPAESEHHSCVTVQVISMEGYGTDAYLHINRLGNSEEPLR